MMRLVVTASFCAMVLSTFGADYAQASALARNGTWEIGVVYATNVNRIASATAANYLLPAEAQLQAIRDVPQNNAVVLTVSGLATNANYSITLTNVQSTGGATLPATTLSFSTGPFSWAAIGGQELGIAPDAVAVGDNGFDLVSAGVEMWSAYDESSFAYEQHTGDFDRRVRVLSQEGSSEEARAGLMVREFVDENKPRPTDPTNPAETFSRYLQVQVNPATTAFNDFEGQPVPGRNQYQINFRSLPGGSTENPVIEENTAPAYPNAWLRLKRVGQTFHVFRGNDGTNWVRLGSFTFPATDLDGNPVTPFSSTAFVGPNYSPETANIPESSGARRAFLARFRDYSEAFGDVPVDPPVLNIVRVGDQVEITWGSGTLEGTTNVTRSAWTVLGTVSPLRITPDKRSQFFRARNP